MEPERKWPEGWETAMPSARKSIGAQLRRELGVGHALAALVPKYIGRNGGGDDFVFSVDHWEAPYFVVHLTWNDGSNLVLNFVPLERIFDLYTFSEEKA